MSTSTHSETWNPKKHPHQRRKAIMRGKRASKGAASVPVVPRVIRVRFVDRSNYFSGYNRKHGLPHA